MPLYEYQCEACGERFEVIQKFSDPAPDACEKCGKGPVHRQQSSPAIQFKGSGWYITDYAQKGRTGGDKAGGDKTSGESGPSKNSSGATSGESSSSDSSKSDSAKTSDTSSATTSTPSTPAKN